MKTDNLSDIEVATLGKLLSRKKIHSNHIRLNTLLKCGWKPHEKGQVKEAVKSLIKKDFIRWVKRGKQALSLNKEKVAQVITICAKEPSSSLHKLKEMKTNEKK